MNPLKYEPAAIVAAVVAILSCFMAFGLNITAEQVAAVQTALLAVGAIFIRSQTVTKAHVQDVVDADGAAEDLLP